MMETDLSCRIVSDAILAEQEKKLAFVHSHYFSVGVSTSCNGKRQLAVVTLQAFTRGKSFYLGKISLGKFTSGFIFPWSHWRPLDFGRFNVTKD